MPGSTFDTMPWRVSGPPVEPVDGWTCSGGSRDPWVVVGLVAVVGRNSPHPSPTPAPRNSRAATTEDTTTVHRRRRRGGTAIGGIGGMGGAGGGPDARTGS